MRLFHRVTGALSDAVLCAMINRTQWHLRHLTCTREEYFSYLEECEPLTPEEFYARPDASLLVNSGNWIEGEFRCGKDFPENEKYRARVFWVDGKPNPRPTVLLLHALMSAQAWGYYRIAKKFNAAGWNAVFPHLPYHYSRVPKGYANGVLALTPNLVRNGETLRRGVREGRVLMQWLRERAGVREFGLIGTSYGGWNGALLASLEPGWRFLALVQPVANVHRAIWHSRISRSMRQALLERGIGPGPDLRHAHLSCPTRALPLAAPEKVILVAGEFDTVTPLADLQDLAVAWKLPDLVRVPQAHFGYRTMREALRHAWDLL